MALSIGFQTRVSIRPKVRRALLSSRKYLSRAEAERITRGERLHLMIASEEPRMDAALMFLLPGFERVTFSVRPRSATPRASNV